MGLEGWGLQRFTVNLAYVQVRRDQDGEFSTVYNRLWMCKVLSSSALFIAWRVLENMIASRVKIPCVVCAGRRKSRQVIYFPFVVLLGVFGVFAFSSLVCRS